MKNKKIACLGLFLLIFCPLLSLQQVPMVENRIDSTFVNDFEKKSLKTIDSISFLNDMQYIDSVRYDYKVFSFEHAKKTFAWQYTSGIIIFWIVIIIVFCGLFLSGMQFYLSIKEKTLFLKDQNSSNIELLTTGLKISSPIIGILILFISLAFLYLYLVYVYPISIVNRF